MAQNDKKRKYSRKNTTRRDFKDKNSVEERDYRTKKKLDATSPEASNDPSWYSANAQLLVDAASLAYSNPLGKSVTISPLVGNYGISESTEIVTPGIMTLGIVTGPGVGGELSSPLNMAATNIYSYVRHANSGHANYDAPDLMMYLLAMDSAYQWWSNLVRAYGVARMYSQRNRYYPVKLLAALGFQPFDIINNLANLRFWINTISVKLGSLCVPSSMPLFLRHIWMFQNIYLDSPSLKAQSYAFTPDVFYTYEETAGVGKLEPVFCRPGGETPHPQGNLDGGWTYESIVNFTRQMLDVLLASEDIGIMSGDILKAFGSDGVLKLESLPEDYTTNFTYSEEVMMQIHNATAIGRLLPHEMAGYGPDITQSPNINGGLIWKPLVANYDALDITQIVNMYKDNVSPADTMVATRLKVVGFEHFEGVPEGWNLDPREQVVAPIVTGSEFVTEFRIWSDPTNPLQMPIFLTSMAPENYVANSFYLTIKECAQLSVFDMHPIIYTISTSDDAVHLRNVIADLENFTTVDLQTINKMHTTALLSEFNVPLMGSWANKNS